MYEVESIDQGLTRDLLYSPDGTAVEIEEAVPPANLPEPVTAGVKQLYPKATITKGERVTRGQAVTYELELQGAPVKSLALNPDGTKVATKK